MSERMGHTEPFQSGQQTNAKDRGEKAPVKSNMSKVRNAGKPDPLTQALEGKQPPLLPADTHTFRHSKTSAPRGAHYSPAGEFGKPSAGKSGMTRPTNPMGGRGGTGTFRGNP